MKTEEKLNLTMLCDFYELTMGNGYFRAGLQDRITYFDVFFRNVPDNGGFAVCAGLEQLVQYIQNLHFDEEDIAFLRDKHLFSEDFLSYLRDFRFTGDIWAVPEGTPIFPREPVVTVRAPAIQAQLIETFTLLTINHQSLIATKANRIVRAAQGRTVLEFGSRRAQGTDGAISGARAAYIGGCAGTACTISDQLYGVPAGGTMAHAWVQMFDSEYDAFKTYCQIYPHNATLLVDTYNTLKSGVPNAIRAFNEVLKPMGITKCGIRLDSGDMAYLTRKARKMLDEAGFLTFRSYAGLEDFFVYHAKVLSPEKSDFQYAEDIRVKNKVIREVRKEALLLLNDDIDMTDFDGETQARAKFLTAPLDRMVAAKEISRAEVTIPEGQAESFLETGLLRVRILYLSRGYIREIEIEVGRTNVSD